MNRYKITIEDRSAEEESVIAETGDDLGLTLAMALVSARPPRKEHLLSQVIANLATWGELYIIDFMEASTTKLVDAADAVNMIWGEHDKRFGITND